MRYPSCCSSFFFSAKEAAALEEQGRETIFSNLSTWGLPAIMVNRRGFRILRSGCMRTNGIDERILDIVCFRDPKLIVRVDQPISR